MPWTTSIVAGFILLVGIQSVARADIYAYMNTIDRNLGTIDLNTGGYSQIGPTDLGVDNIELAGLGEIDSTLYGASYGASQDSLYTINTTTGALTLLGGNGNTLSYLAFGSTTSTLYALVYINTGPHFGDFELYSVNSSSGTATDVGFTGLAAGSAYELSTGSGTLYFALGDQLYTLDTGSGLATALPDTTGSPSGPQFGGLVTEGGTLYGGDYYNETVDTLNTSTGVATIGPGLSPTTYGDFQGLAPAVPEPTSVLLFGTLIAGVFFLRRKKHTV